MANMTLLPQNMPDKRVLLLLPAYNEAAYLPAVCRELRACCPGMDVLAVDDGSADSTAAVAREHGLAVLRHPFNLGDGAARHTGYIYAMRKGYDFVVQLDADGQHDPADIAALLRPVLDGKADLTIGSRFLAPTDYKPSAAKKIGMLVFNALASLLTGLRITDSTSGFRAANRKVIEFYSLPDFYPTSYPDADLIILSHAAGLRIQEVPVSMRHSRKPLPLHHGMAAFYYVFKMFLSISVTLLRAKPARREEKP